MDTGSSRAAKELHAAIETAKTGKPVYDFPPELPEEQRKYWMEIVNCKPHDYFNSGDLTLLKMYCRCAHDVDRLTTEIDQQGEVIRNARGNPVVNPRIVIRSFAECRLMTLASKLHMQPASRVVVPQDGKTQKRKSQANMLVSSLLGDGDSDGLIGGLQ